MRAHVRKAIILHLAVYTKRSSTDCQAVLEMMTDVRSFGVARPCKREGVEESAKHETTTTSDMCTVPYTVRRDT